MNKTFDLWDSETKTSLPVEASKAGHEWKARCPKHADNTPSLSINEEKKRFHCFGCNFSGSLYDASRDPANKKARTGKRIVATYDYRDENGKLISQTVRYDPKDFKQRRPDGNGGWIWNLEGIQTILYRLPEILKADEVMIVEGEKDVDNLIPLGFTATTCPMGAKKWRAHYNQFLEGKDLILCPDNDPEGREHMKQVGTSLNGTSKSLKWLELPDLPNKGDISTWLERFQNLDEARERLSIMIENAEPYTLAKEEGQGNGVKELSYLNLNLPSSLEISRMEIKVDWVVKNLIPKESITLIHSVGESLLVY